MDQHAVLTAFDRQIRQHPERDDPADIIERDEHVVRVMSTGWSGITWCDLAGLPADPPSGGGLTIDAVIAAQVGRFAELGNSWEWKHYSHDRPADLADRLRAAGFIAEPAEALMVAEIGELDRDVLPPPGVRLEPITDADGVAALVRVHDEVFGGDHSQFGRTLLARLQSRPDTVTAVLAVAGDTPIAGARVEFHTGTEFASLWGGGTLRAWRGRGVFRSLVAYRAALAAAAGLRYLQVDASDDSRPILHRLGFIELATTTPFIHPGTAVAGDTHAAW